MTIRKQPGDFVVREVLAADMLRSASPERGGRGHALYELRKESLTTPEAVRGLARALRVREGDVSYAGLKDKHAVTAQHVSVAMGPRAAASRLADGDGWTARLLGWVERPLAAAAIERNEFEIIVRDLSPAAAAEMDRRAGLLRFGSGEQGERLLFVNYFGDQRFGSARHGQGFAAKHMVRGEFEAALRLAIATPARKDTGLRRRFTRLAAERWGRWAELAATLPACAERAAVERLAAGAGFDEALGALPAFQRMMLVEAYQSHLWNQTARRLVEGPGVGPEARIAADGPFGAMLFPRAGDVPGELVRAAVPMPAPDLPLSAPWGAAAAGVLSEEGITLGDLRLPRALRMRFGAAWRPLFAEASRFALGDAGADGPGQGPGRLQRPVRFDLPRGAYATVVLRALGA